MVNTAYDTARETPAASPWAAVGVSAFDELLYQAILNQPDAGAAGWALLTGASPARSGRPATGCSRSGCRNHRTPWAGYGRSTRGWRSAR